MCVHIYIYVYVGIHFQHMNASEDVSQDSARNCSAFWRRASIDTALPLWSLDREEHKWHDLERFLPRFTLGEAFQTQKTVDTLSV